LTFLFLMYHEKIAKKREGRERSFPRELDAGDAEVRGEARQAGDHEAGGHVVHSLSLFRLDYPRHQRALLIVPDRK
jgi:hypothetical protein